MRNYLLKTFAFCFLLFSGIVQMNAQEYLPTDEAIENLQEKRAEAIQIIAELNGQKSMDLMKAKATKKLVESMLRDFRSGKSTEEVAELNNTSMQLNQAQSIKPLFADSSGKVGTNWINEELLVLLEKK